LGLGLGLGDWEIFVRRLSTKQHISQENFSFASCFSLGLCWKTVTPRRLFRLLMQINGKSFLFGTLVEYAWMIGYTPK